jgi:hypothetical protein
MTLAKRKNVTSTGELLTFKRSTRSAWMSLKLTNKKKRIK